MMVQDATSASEVDYWTIEGMRSQQFSVGIFIFMMAGVLVFAAIIYRFMRGDGKGSKLKLGEKVMFIWIILGTTAAVIFGALQLLQGYLF